MLVGTPLDDVALRDHLPDIVEAIVVDLRTPQTASEERNKSEGRALSPPGKPRSAAGTHALHRAHSGYSISHLVSEYRALRASVLRLWADQPGLAGASPGDITRFNEAIDEAIAESVIHFAAEVERWRNIFLGVLGHDLRSPLASIVMTSELLARMAVDAPVASVAQRLIRSGKRMRELLDRLLVYNRAQMGMGFILPFALTFVAIPFETFVHSSRTVLGLCGIALLRAIALVFRVLSNSFHHIGKLLERLYDLPLFVPLWLETRAKAAAAADRPPEVAPVQEAQT